MTLSPVNIVTVTCDCGKVITGANRLRRCPACAKKAQLAQMREASRLRRAGGKKDDEGEKWRMVKVPDPASWGRRPEFSRVEIDAMLEQGVLEDGTLFAKGDNLWVVRGNRLRVYIPARGERL